ncbi:MAG: VCBS repeat-containing protein [Desulfatibacillum sp.]|nr:VCBS repeat-containing protein [Desulfatibacillum sp.]
MESGKMLNTNNPQEVAKALAVVGSSVLLANPKMGCAMALTNTGKGLETKAHVFSTPHPITTKGALSLAACNELAASGIMPSMECSSHASTKRLVARGAMAAAFSGALLFGMGASDAMAQGFGYNYYGGTNPLEDVWAYNAKPAFVDIDNDGDLDCFVGENGGTVQFWKNSGTPRAASFTRMIGADNPLSDTNVLDLASPAFVDIDGDGDMDAFIGHANEMYQTWGEYSGEESLVTFLENTGTPEAPVFNFNAVASDTRKTITENPLIVQGGYFAAPTFADIDGDGDMDAFVGDSYGNIRRYENVTGENPSKAIRSTIVFVSRGPLPGKDSYPIDADNGNAAPSFVDVDGDGDLDLFVGNKYGAIQYFENTGSAQEFEFTERTMSQNPLRVNPGINSAPVFADINGDGLADCFMGSSWTNTKRRIQEPTESPTDFYSNLFVRYYQNTGTATKPAFLSRGDNPFNLGPNALMASPALGDIDNDGDLDALVGSMSIGKKAQSKDNKGSYFGSRALRYYENTGEASAPVFALWSGEDDPWSIPSNWQLPTPAIADLNGDGFNEVYMGYTSYAGGKESSSYTNHIDAYQFITDTKSFVAASQNPLNDLVDLPGYPGPAFVDIDGDGDLDLFVAGSEYMGEYIRPNGQILFYRNEGTSISPTFALVTGDANPLTGIEGMVISRLSFADVDGDGDMDAVLSEMYPNDSAFRKSAEPTMGTRYFKNTGTKTSPVFEEKVDNANPFEVTKTKTILGATALADLDNDHDIDAVMGDYNGKLYYFRNIKTVEEANAILKDDDDWLCFVDSAQSEVSLWNRLTDSCKQSAQKIKNFFSPS